MSENFFKDDYPIDLGLDIQSFMNQAKFENVNSFGDMQKPKNSNTKTKVSMGVDTMIEEYPQIQTNKQLPQNIQKQKVLNQETLQQKPKQEPLKQSDNKPRVFEIDHIFQDLLPVQIKLQQQQLQDEIERFGSFQEPQTQQQNLESLEEDNEEENETNDSEIMSSNKILEISREIIKECETSKEYRIKYSNGDIYEGEIDEKTNLKDGWGIYFFINGEKYEGFFEDDIIEGMGKYYFLGDHTYDGEWYQGKKQGIGILTYSNGSVYKGEFQNDNYNGEGELTYANGDKFTGIFKNGKKNGKGKFVGAGGKHGRIIIGQWSNDELQPF